jgi:phosphoglycolate phosphatase
MDKLVTSEWNQVRLLVFDLDGTLVDSKQDLALSVNAMRTEMGLAPLPLDLIASYVGHGVTLLVRRSLGPLATSENVEKGLAFFLNYYRDHMLDHTGPYPGVAEALDKLAGHKMAVLTNKPVNFSREMLTRLGFAPFFAYIYGGNSFPQKKPDPTGLHKLMEDLQVPARQTLTDSEPTRWRRFLPIG